MRLNGNLVPQGACSVCGGAHAPIEAVSRIPYATQPGTAEHGREIDWYARHGVTQLVKLTQIEAFCEARRSTIVHPSISGDIELRTPGGRVYGITDAPTLWTLHGLYIVWGRTGFPLRRRIETFDDRAALERRWRQLVNVRRRHGYVEIRRVR